jgi:hypothetical protein
MVDDTKDQPTLPMAKCKRCYDTGWLKAIDGWSDGSYVTRRPCNCDAAPPPLKW